MAMSGRGGNPGWWVPLDSRADRVRRRDLVREEQERQLLREQGVDISGLQAQGEGENASQNGQHYEEEMQMPDPGFEDAEDLNLSYRTQVLLIKNLTTMDSKESLVQENLKNREVLILI